MSNTLLAGATTATATSTTSAVERLSQQYASQRANGSSGSSGSSSTTSKTGTASGMGQEAFLKMFMAQMTNQNPLDPMDNTEFTAQLAQFSSLEQLTKISKSMEGLSSLQDTMTQTQVLGYLGKEVTMSGNQLTVSDGQAGKASFTLASNANVKAIITDSTGAVVASKSLGSLSAGSRTFQWDGTNDSGAAVADGTYTVSIQATDNSGASVKVSDLAVSGVVTGYRKGSDGKTYLLVGTAELPLTSVTSVRQPSGTGSGSASSSLESLYNSYTNSNSGSGKSFSDWLSSLTS
ncbi:MAG: flagellar hook capping protein [Desulfovibrio sp.]|nr:flagellar hook capping protein [Desulfovibrio sp.]